MGNGKMGPVARTLLAVVGVFAACLAVGYVRAMLTGAGAFTPNWTEDAAIAVAAGVATYFGPDALRRRRERQDWKGGGGASLEATKADCHPDND